LGLIPVHKGPGRPSSTPREWGGEPVPIPPQNVANGGPGEREPLVLGQVERQALGPEPGPVLGGDDPLLDLRAGLARLTMRSVGLVGEFARPLLGPDGVDHRAGNAEGPSGGRYVAAGAREIVEHRQAGGDRVDAAQRLVVDHGPAGGQTGSRGASWCAMLLLPKGGSGRLGSPSGPFSLSGVWWVHALLPHPVGVGGSKGHHSR